MKVRSAYSSLVAEAIAEKLAKLPPEKVEELKNDQRSKRISMHAVNKATREAKIDRRLRILELLLSGHTQAEISSATNIPEKTVERTLKDCFPFGKAGREHRYIIIKLSTKSIAMIDQIAERMLLSRTRVLELHNQYGFEDTGIKAKRTLGLVNNTVGE